MGLFVVARRGGGSEDGDRVAGGSGGEDGETDGGFQRLGAEGGEGHLAVLDGQVGGATGYGGEVVPLDRDGLEQQRAFPPHLAGEGFIGLVVLGELVHRRNGQVAGVVEVLVQPLQPLFQGLVLQAAGDEALFGDLPQGQRPVRFRCAGSHGLKALHGHGEHTVLHLAVLIPMGGLGFGGGDEHQLAAGQGGAGTGFDGQGTGFAGGEGGFQGRGDAHDGKLAGHGTPAGVRVCHRQEGTPFRRSCVLLYIKCIKAWSLW